MRLDKDLILINVIYKHIINNLTEFFTHIGISNDINGIYAFTKHMINNEYLSLGKIYTSKTIPKELIDIENNYFGFDKVGLLLPLGCGTCRHRANFLYSIYSNLGYKNSETFTYVPNISTQFKVKDDDYSIEEIQKIINTIEEILINLNGKDDITIEETINEIKFKAEYIGASDLDIKIGNHVVNIILDKHNILHILDSMRDAVITKDKDNTTLYSYDQYGLYNRQYVKTSNSQDYKRTFLKGINLLQKYPTTENIKSELEEIKTLENICKKYQKEFIKFYENNLRYYEMIYKNTYNLIRKKELIK